MGFSLQKGIRGTWDNARGIINSNLAKIESAISSLPAPPTTLPPRVAQINSSSTPLLDVSTDDQLHIDRLVENILGVTVVGVVPGTTNNDGWTIEFHITDDGTPRSITWGSQFAATAVPLPTTTVANQRLIVQ